MVNFDFSWIFYLRRLASLHNSSCASPCTSPSTFTALLSTLHVRNCCNGAQNMNTRYVKTRRDVRSLFSPNNSSRSIDKYYRRVYLDQRQTLRILMSLNDPLLSRLDFYMIKKKMKEKGIYIIIVCKHKINFLRDYRNSPIFDAVKLLDQINFLNLP